MRAVGLYAKSGAVFYVLWALLHVYVAYKLFAMADGVGAAMVSARLDQLAFYIGAAGLFAAIFALDNWRNGALGYWGNLLLVSTLDIGYVWFVVLRVDMPIVEALLGPALWVIAASFSSLGYWSADRFAEAKEAAST